MPIDRETYRAPAIRGDITGIAISASIALDRIASAIDALAALEEASDAEKDRLRATIKADVAKVRSEASDIEKQFDRLSGWTPEP